MSATACSGATSAWYAGGNASRQTRNASTPGLLAARGDERVVQLVDPRARQRRELRLERGLVDRRRSSPGVCTTTCRRASTASVTSTVKSTSVPPKARCSAARIATRTCVV